MTIIYNLMGPGPNAGNVRLSGSLRYGMVFESGSSLFGKNVKSWMVSLKGVTGPSGAVTVAFYNSAGTRVAGATEVVEASTIPTAAFTNYTFNFSGTGHTIDITDRLVVEYSGSPQVNIEIWNTDQFDGAFTRRTRWDGNSYLSSSTEDIIGTIDNGASGTITIVSGLPELFSGCRAAGGGDTVQLADGTYTNSGRVDLNGISGVVVMAQNRGGAIINGYPINLKSHGITFEGFDLQYNVSGDLIVISGNGCHFTKNNVHPTEVGAVTEVLTVMGHQTIIDYNEFHDKSGQGTMTLIGTGTALVTGCKIMYNSYHDRAVHNSGSPAEAIRVGSSETAWLNFGTEIGYNRFERIDGETELITLKGSYMNVHHNTAINCNSSFTFRHGNFGTFDANVCLNAGLRIYGHGHTITRNQFIAVTHNQLRQAITIGQGTVADDDGSSGVIGTSNANHAQVRDCVIANNIAASDNATALNIMTLGFDTSGGTFGPSGNTINYNIITASTGVLTKADNGALWTANIVSGNILWPTGTATVGDMTSGAYFLTNPQLLRLSDTTCRCAYVLGSGLVGPAATTY